MKANQIITLAGLLVTVVISLYFSIFTVNWIFFRNRIRKKGEKVKGVIVDYEVDTSGDGTSYKPVVRFATKEGTIVTVTSQEGGGDTKHYQKEVTVFYNPSKPKEVSIAETDAPVIAIVIIILFCLFALCISTYHLSKHIMNWR